MELVDIEVAMLAKEKGFDEVTALVYNTYYKKTMGNINSLKHSDGDNPMVSLPEQCLLQKWLRDNHGLHITIRVKRKDRVLEGFWSIVLSKESNMFTTYEEALEEGLKKALELI